MSYLFEIGPPPQLQKEEHLPALNAWLQHFYRQYRMAWQINRAPGSGLTFNNTTNAMVVNLGGGLEFTGSGVIQRSALVGDVTAPAASNTTTIAANAVTNAMLRQSGGLTVVGRSANSTGNVADIGPAQANQVLQCDGTTVGWGTAPNQFFFHHWIKYATPVGWALGGHQTLYGMEWTVPTGYSMAVLASYCRVKTGATAGDYSISSGWIDYSTSGFTTLATVEGTENTWLVAYAAGTVDSPLDTIAEGTSVAPAHYNDAGSAGACADDYQQSILIGVLI